MIIQSSPHTTFNASYAAMLNRILLSARDSKVVFTNRCTQKCSQPRHFLSFCTIRNRLLSFSQSLVSIMPLFLHFVKCFLNNCSFVIYNTFTFLFYWCINTNYISNSHICIRNTYFCYNNIVNRARRKANTYTQTLYILR